MQQRKDPQVLEEQQQAVNERMQAILQKAQSRLGELVRLSTSLAFGSLITRPTGGLEEPPANLDIYKARPKLYLALQDLIGPVPERTPHSPKLPRAHRQPASWCEPRSSLHSFRGLAGSFGCGRQTWTVWLVILTSHNDEGFLYSPLLT